jgi:hypothetical protein
LEDKIILLHLRTDRFYELNRTAARLWELLGKGYVQAELEKQMALEFDLGPAELADQIGTLLTSLKVEKLVSVEKEE